MTDEKWLASQLLRYWGKADPAYSGTPKWHPLVWHSLDVAAVAHQFLLRRPALLGLLAGALGMPSACAHRLIVLLVGLHDLGKFADNFQAKREDLYRAAFPARDPHVFDSLARHDAVGFAFWCAPEAAGLRDQLRHRLPQWPTNLLMEIMASSCGHHGLPPEPLTDPSLYRAMGPDSRADALWFAAQWIEFSWPSSEASDTPNPASAGFATFQWWFAGVTILCDWVGSNTEWFPYQGPDPDADKAEFADYWGRTIERAGHALDEARLLPVRGAPYAGFAAVLADHQPPRPMQQAVADLVLRNGPQLIVIEDSTGAGKTEAALLLAHRLIAQGRAEGVYFGLPTQATANGLFPRLQRIAPNLLDTPELAALMLVHGASALHPGFREFAERANQDAIRGERETASMGFSAWVADHRKRALLAQVGVGTLDQALLGALRCKHNALRLLGLVGKVLIVDEVHAYDTYMLGMLRALLELHARAGGSTILLSATLPAHQRKALLQCCWEVFQQPPVPAPGQLPVRRRPPPLPELTQRDCYPLLTTLDREGLRELLVAPVEAARRTLSVRYTSDASAIRKAVLEAAADDQCVVWIHNTVRAAQQTFAQLQDEAGARGIRLTLFHARFALCDRMVIENRILADFGPRSTATQRARQIVISTQVIESSLDLCFDWLVSELAPIDLLLQRFGRWRRHPRSTAGDPISSADQRTRGELIVLGPERTPAPQADWLSAYAPGSAKVYADHGQLYLTASALENVLQLPEQQRALVEQVYAPDACAPPAFDRARNRVEGQHAADTQMADFNAIDWKAGYRRDLATWPDDTAPVTRLGDPTVEVALARVVNGRIEPWAPRERADQPEFERWALSVVRLRSAQITARAPLSDTALEQQALQMEAELPALRWRVLLPLTLGPSSNWRATALRQGRAEGGMAVAEFQYSEMDGLRSG